MELWIARDEHGYLGLYKSEPKYKEFKHGIKDWHGGFIGLLDSDFFPEVTFENSPQQIELKLVEK